MLSNEERVEQREIGASEMKWSDETVEAFASLLSNAPFPSIRSKNKAKAALAAAAQSSEVQAKDAALIKAREVLSDIARHSVALEDYPLGMRCDEALTTINEVLS